MTNNLPIIYATYFPMFKDIAREHGYSLSLHGSMLRDMDLIAVPWIDDCSDHETLLSELCKVVGTYVEEKPYHSIEIKPHNRIAYTFQVGGPGGYVDISIMSPLTKKQKK